MPKFNQEGYGQTIRVNFHEDVSSASAYAMTIQPEAGQKVQVTPTLGTSAVTVDDEVMAANEYVEFVVESGNFDHNPGRWRKQATATMSATVSLKSDFTGFRLMPSVVTINA